MEQPAFYLKNKPVFGDLILSPMDGITDQPFRLLARSLGSAMSYSEFINTLDFVNKRPHLEQRLTFCDAERPFIYQLLDNDPQRLQEIALRLQDRNPDAIDINMGCPSRSVTNRGAGAGLLRDPEKITRIINTLSNSLRIPVTVKIRLGWDERTLNYLEIAHIVEDNGAALIAVHGRTKSHAYQGQAIWDPIAEVKRAVKIPVIANGDVRTVRDIERIKTLTNCDAVMIGRAAVENPWLFCRLDRQQVPLATVKQTMLRHLQAQVDFYGRDLGLILFRKFARKYLKLYALPKDLEIELLTITDLQAFLDKLDDIFISLEPRFQ
jgi:tRNA-dihydrouridine synthase B